MAHDEPHLRVEVVYSTADGLIIQEKLQMASGATLAHALQKSCLLERQPELWHAPCGIWGRLCKHDQVLRDQDRIEIYRPLVLDPKEARRQRQSKQGKASKKA